ncbi:MAG: hypothetical protein AABX85_00425 [Nanoarchaeota archaeon]
MKILFICKYNRFRSKCAEALFIKYNKNKNHEVKSAGILIDAVRPFMAQGVVDELKERGAEVVDRKSQEVNETLIKWADRIIIVADNVDIDGFLKGKVEVWPVRDASEHELNEIKSSIFDIEERVFTLAERIKSGT